MSVPLINSGGGANKLLRSFSRSTQLSLKRSKNLNNFPQLKIKIDQLMAPQSCAQCTNISQKKGGQKCCLPIIM